MGYSFLWVRLLHFNIRFTFDCFFVFLFISTEMISHFIDALQWAHNSILLKLKHYITFYQCTYGAIKYCIIRFSCRLSIAIEGAIKLRFVLANENTQYTWHDKSLQPQPYSQGLRMDLARAHPIHPPMVNIFCQFFQDCFTIFFKICFET